MTLSREDLERLRLSIDEIEDSQGVFWDASDLAAQCLAQMDEIETLRKQVEEKDRALNEVIYFPEYRGKGI